MAEKTYQDIAVDFVKTRAALSKGLAVLDHADMLTKLDDCIDQLS